MDRHREHGCGKWRSPQRIPVMRQVLPGQRWIWHDEKGGGKYFCPHLTLSRLKGTNILSLLHLQGPSWDRLLPMHEHGAQEVCSG